MLKRKKESESLFLFDDLPETRIIYHFLVRECANFVQEGNLEEASRFAYLSTNLEEIVKEYKRGRGF